ncbi:MAG: rane protein [Gammaproteobacteria bacterium]|nr:rane protein [Gammaproteobacteria bacterium]
MTLNLIAAFTLGLFSTVHCLGMCGGIITALSLGLPETIRLNKRRFALLVSCYNFGRVLSYSLAGALAGFFGQVLLNLIDDDFGHYVLRGLAGLLLVLLGLHIGGWTGALRRLEGIGLTLWQIIRPIGGYFLPVDTPYKALLLGCIWGWLPCGLVYSVLLWSATSVDPVAGTLTMLCLGLGTLPGMITAGLFSSSLQQLATRANIRKVFALIIICFGLLSPWLQPDHHTHATTPEIQHVH